MTTFLVLQILQVYDIFQMMLRIISGRIVRERDIVGMAMVAGLKTIVAMVVLRHWYVRVWLTGE